ncbi:MAG: rhodanese-like domain-containing protein [Gammaproteobacteria bacterium]
MADSDNIDVSNFVDSAVGIDAENLIELYRSMQDVVLIDSRLSEDRVHGYIEMSQSLPVADTNCASLAKILDNKDQPVVFYDNGKVSSAGMVATSIAATCGYKRLFWFSGGFAEWEDKDYPFVIE